MPMRQNLLSVPRAAFGIYLILKYYCHSEYVVTPWNVCIDVVFAIIKAGKKPYFVHYQSTDEPISNLDLEKIPKNIDTLLHIHIFGEFYAISDRLRERFSLIIEDAAQAAGSKYKGLHAGFNADFGIFSFGKHKQIDLGGGGLIYSSNAKKLDILMKDASCENCQDELRFFENTQKNNALLYDKIYEFEGNPNVDWYIPKLCPNVIMWPYNKGFAELDLKKILLNYDAFDRILCINNFLQKLDFANLTVGHTNSSNNLWRICVKPKVLNRKKYVDVFSEFRKNNIACSNWYYPAHLIFGYQLNSKYELSLADFSRFQFTVSSDERGYFIDNEETILDILERNYGDA